MKTITLPDYPSPLSQKVLLLYGGTSGEHEVSCSSAAFVFANLQRAGFQVFAVYIDHQGRWYLSSEIRQQGAQPNDQAVVPLFSTDIKDAENRAEKTNKLFLSFADNRRQEIDFVFSIVHGTGGEDGRLQGAMEFFQIPFAGASMISSSLCMDKGYMRDVFSVAQIPQVIYTTFFKECFQQQPQNVIKEIENLLEYPVFIKPCNMGSSVGVHKVHAQNELMPALQDAFRYDLHVIVEQGKDVREFEVAVLGNYPHYYLTRAGEVVSNHEFYSYAAKYQDENGATLKLPAEIDADMQKEIQEVARKAFAAMRGDGFARVDIFWDVIRQKAYINEINTLPGFTKISMFPKLWQMEGMASEELIRRIVVLGEQKLNEQKKIITKYSF